MLKVMTIISVMIIFISCSNENNIITPIEDSAFIPLNVGNYWKYSITDYDTLGYAFNDYEWTNTITLDTNIDNNTFYKFNNPNILYQLTDEGFYQNYILNNKIEKTNYLYKYPCDLGERYWVNEKDSIYSTVIAVDEEIEIHSVKYKCIGYDIISYSGNDKNTERIFIEPGIGIIMQIVTKQAVSGKNYVSARFMVNEYNINN